MSKVFPMTMFLPDQRDVEISRYGFGNEKLGLGIFTFSRLAGGEETCPGASAECEDICYAKRIEGPVRDIYAQNSKAPRNRAWAKTYGQLELVPPIPDQCRVLRIHISGDFDCVEYIHQWIDRLKARPDVTAWAYTRSWRVPELVGALQELHDLPNLQLFASMDPSLPNESAPPGWRRAWIWRDKTNGQWPRESRIRLYTSHNAVSRDGTPAYVCPEETGRRSDCASCGYCFEGVKHDVVFLEH